MRIGSLKETKMVQKLYTVISSLEGKVSFTQVIHPK